MKTYPITPRGGLIVVGGMFLLVGGPFLVFPLRWLLGLMTINGKSQAESPGDFLLAVIVVAFGLVAVLLGWKHLWRLPYEIRIGSDGIVEIARVLRRARVRAREIRVIEKVVARLVVEDADPRELRIRLGRGTVLVSHFAMVEEFIADVRAMNPSISVVGEWPSATE